jgi:hypothetical protein
MTAPIWFVAPAHDAVLDFRAVLPAEWMRRAGWPAGYATWGELPRRLQDSRHPQSWVLSPPALGLPGALLAALDRLPIRLIVNFSPPPWALPAWHPVWQRVPRDYAFPVHRALAARAACLIVHDAAVLPALEAPQPAVAPPGEGEHSGPPRERPAPGQDRPDVGPAEAGPRRAVIPDALGPLPAVPDRDPGRPIEVAWVGSTTHAGDLPLLVAPLRTLLAEEPRVRVTFLGAPAPAGLSGARVTARTEWEPLAACLDRLRALAPDVIVLPLAESPGNAYRGGTAALLAGAVGAAVIASARGPFARELHPGTEALLVDDDAAAWWGALRALVRAPERRAALGRNLRAWVERTRTLTQTGPQWAEALAA